MRKHPTSIDKNLALSVPPGFATRDVIILIMAWMTRDADGRRSSLLIQVVNLSTHDEIHIKVQHNGYYVPSESQRHRRAG